MQFYEYKVVPAPRKGEKARGTRTTPDRFALALTSLMNDLGRDGWDYLRADTLPCDERVGLTGSKTSFQNMLVFRRVMEADAASAAAPLQFQTRLSAVENTAPRLGAAVAPEGVAPALGSATLNAGLAAE